jgi:hypothetical protein
MTVDQPRVVDYLGLEKGTGDVVLTIVDGRDWQDERAHLLALQAKLNTYFEFVESGEVFERLAEDLNRTVERNTPIKVQILSRFPLPEAGLTFLERARSVFSQAGLEIAFRVVPESS